MKRYLALLLLGSATALGDVVGKLGVAVDLPAVDGWVFVGRTEIPEERMEVWTSRNSGRRESIQFSVMTLGAGGPAQTRIVSSWEQGLLSDGRKEKIFTKDIELCGRKARYVVARWRERELPFFHFVIIADERRAVFFSIVSPTDSELGGEVAAKCVRSLRIGADEKG